MSHLFEMYPRAKAYALKGKTLVQVIPPFMAVLGRHVVGQRDLADEALLTARLTLIDNVPGGASLPVELRKWELGSIS